MQRCSQRRSPHRLLRAGVALLCLLLAVPAAWARGDFEIRSALAFERDGVYYIDANIFYELNDTAIEALGRGVALTFEVQFEVQRKRRWRPDKNIAELEQLYELQYHALSQRYIVRNLNSGDQDTYITLNTALQALGDIDDLPLLDAALNKGGRPFQVRMRAVLDIRSWPGPLRLVSGFFGDWRLASRWYEWDVTP